jgi:hypothetical protein
MPYQVKKKRAPKQAIAMDPALLGNHGGLGDKNCSRTIATAAPAARSVVASAPLAEGSSEQEAEVRILRGKLISSLVHFVLIFFFFFLVQIDTIRKELKTAQEAATIKELPPIPRPSKVTRLRGEMHLGNDAATFADFCVSFFFL